MNQAVDLIQLLYNKFFKKMIMKINKNNNRKLKKFKMNKMKNKKIIPKSFHNKKQPKKKHKQKINFKNLL